MPKDKTLVAVVTEQTYQRLLEQARLNNDTLSALAGRILDDNFMRCNMPDMPEPENTGTVEDGVLIEDDTTIQEALEQWNVLTKSETE